MPRDTSTDNIAESLIVAVSKVVSNLAGWGSLASGAPAVYAQLGLPFPQEPFPACYIYMGNWTPEYRQGTGIIRYYANPVCRIIGGPITPSYKLVPETTVYTLLAGVTNELSYRRFLEDPTNSDTPFRYIDPEGKVTVQATGRIRGFAYQEQGSFVGIEVPLTVILAVHIGRIG